jgi:hypothetical protein
MLDRAPLSTNEKTHTVWVAFLMFVNEEGPGEQSMKDYWLIPWNRMTVWLTGEDFIHCQIVFWDAVRQRYYTYSVDGDHPVFVLDRKGFNKGWKFVKISVTEAQELLVQNFLIAQLGKILNASGQVALGALQLGIISHGSSGNGEAWFCSELAAAALEHAGIVNYEEWPGFAGAYDVAPHNLFHYLLERCSTAPIELMAGNPVRIREVYERRKAEGAIEIQHGVLPRAVADFGPPKAAPAAPQLYYQRAFSVAPAVQQSRRSALDQFIVTVKK